MADWSNYKNVLLGHAFSSQLFEVDNAVFKILKQIRMKSLEWVVLVHLNLNSLQNKINFLYN